jgi:hypothetical protein
VTTRISLLTIIYREALNSSSLLYQYLCFFKVAEALNDRRVSRGQRGVGSLSGFGRDCSQGWHHGIRGEGHPRFLLEPLRAFGIALSLPRTEVLMPGERPFIVAGRWSIDSARFPQPSSKLRVRASEVLLLRGARCPGP